MNSEMSADLGTRADSVARYGQTGQFSPRKLSGENLHRERPSILSLWVQVLELYFHSLARRPSPALGIRLGDLDHPVFREDSRGRLELESCCFLNPLGPADPYRET